MLERASPSMMTVLLHYRRRNLGHHRSAAPRFALYLEAAAEQGYPLPHAGEADPLPRTAPDRDLARHKAAAPVPHLEPDYPAGAVPERDAHPVGLGVLAHVGKRLLGYPEQGGL